MPSLAHHCREHPGLVWLGAVTLLAAIARIGGVGSLDGGMDSTLFVVFAILAAPFLVVGGLGVALTSWAPIPVQVAVVMILAIGVALVLDDPLRQLLDRFGSSTRGKIEPQ